MHYAGEVYLLPPDAREEGDPKARRHLLLSTQKSPGDILVFAFASTQATEASFGAAHFLLDPFATTYHQTGFAEATYIYPSRLVSVEEEDLVRFMGRVLDEMPAIRDLLRVALGLRTGTGRATGKAAGSWRGAVVRLAPAIAAEGGYTYGLVVTEPQYCRRFRFQSIVPLIDASDIEPEPGEVHVTGAPWSADVGEGLGSAILSVPMITSVFHPREIVGMPMTFVDESTMSEVDAALIHLFDL